MGGTVCLAADASVDVGAAVLVLAFLAWGAMRGALRQLLGLVVLAGAFPLATVASPHVEATLAKVVTLPPEELACVAWLVVFVGTAALGGVVIQVVRGPVGRLRIGGRADRWFAALLGLVKGVLATLVATYGVLGAYSKDAAKPTAVRSIEESRSAGLVVDLGRRVRPWVDLPGPVAACVDRVGASVDRARAAGAGSPEGGTRLVRPTR